MILKPAGIFEPLYIYIYTSLPLQLDVETCASKIRIYTGQDGRPTEFGGDGWGLFYRGTGSNSIR